jgi:transcription-repair coupling factor (superfamily II helicase)
MPFSWNIVKEAIEKELLRGGQIFYLHNHIPTLPIVERKLRELLPQLTLRVAHGSLDREELSSVMLDFLRGEFSLLLATTIIESGLDLPNVNTLIVSGAHKFGLAQLYQIRGRIGRRDKLAYAYLLHPPNLDTEKYKKAKSRLEALKEFSSIGSSLRLAIKDLQMRGCGELLGKRQHGHIKAVGLNLYSKLLKEARDEVAREYNLNSVKDEEDKFSTPIIEPFFDAYIDEFYLPQDVLRFQIYKRLINIKNIQELSEFEEELQDRFGNKLPKGLKQLLILAQLRCQAASAGIDRVYLEEGNELLANRKRVIISLKEAQNLADKSTLLAKKFSSRITFFQQEPKISLYYDSKEELMFLLKEIFDTLKI